ncbi:unnamed protein product [Adineta steineri]|uniref:Uncharacterized protein n=1 Tax=Adineta steineri TaxID=433720 RepID=A0A814IZV3_9BILA|nr:unnamed protein product [Adineta steineri]
MISFSDPSYMLLVIGDTGVGKTAFSSVNSVLQSKESLIDFWGFDFRKKEINLNDKQIILEIESFENLNKWLHEISYYWGKHVMKLIIGNKCDLAEQKAVSVDEAIDYVHESNISIVEVSAQDFTNVELAFEYMISKIRSNLTPTSNDQPDQNREASVLKLVPYISDIGSNAAEQHVNDQGLRVGTENEDDKLPAITEENEDQIPIGIEDNASVPHTQLVDDGALKLARLSLPENQIIEEKAKQPNVFNFSETLKRIFSRKKTIN